MELHAVNGNGNSMQLRLRRIGVKFIKYWQLYVLILPAMVYLIIFNYLPMYGVQIAFKGFRSSLGIWGSPWVGLDNFIRFVRYPYFKLLVWNTLSINLYSLIVGFPFPILLALLINELHNKPFKRTVQMITYAPHFISTVVVCGMIMLFANRSTGILNHIIGAFGMDPINFLGDARWFKPVYVLSGVWQNTGWGTIIYLATLSGVSQELVDAAHCDGARRLGVVRHINIPHMMPTIIILLILNCGRLLNLGFEKIWLLQNSLNLDASEVISTYVYKVGLQGGQYSYSSAIGLVDTAVGLSLIIMVNKLARRISETSLW